MKPSSLALLWTLVSLAVIEVHGTTYYVDCSSAASDLASGTSPATPWRTIWAVSKMTNSPIKPGDTLRLKYGCMWRERLIPVSGNSSAVVTYTTYGDPSLGKPTLKGSAEANDASLWTSIGSNLWTIGKLANISGATNLLPNPSFTTNLNTWTKYTLPGVAAISNLVRDTTDYHSSPASLKFDITAPGSGTSDIQVYTTPFKWPSFLVHKQYWLRFAVKASNNGTLPWLALHRAGSPYDSFATLSPTSFDVKAAGGWKVFECSVVARMGTNMSTARLTFALGGGFPAGTTIHIDSIELVPASGIKLTRDVGLILLNNEFAAVKKWTAAELAAQGHFSCNESLLTMWSTINPALFYTDIELALSGFLVEEGNCHDITFDGFALTLGGEHGFGGGSTHHLIIRNMDISWIGGARLFGYSTRVRYGNGIEFWCESHDNLVEGNRLWEIYDTALTNQCTGTSSQLNLTWRYNVVWNSEFAFEYWNYGGITKGIKVENNVFAWNGYGWSHNQRDDPAGVAFLFYAFKNATEFTIQNNIGFMSKSANIKLWANFNSFFNATIRRNILWEGGNSTLLLTGPPSWIKYKTARQLLNWTYPTNQDCLVVDPKFVDAANLDFRLLPSSPGIGRAIHTSAPFDVVGQSTATNEEQDIGAYVYFVNKTSPDTPTTAASHACTTISLLQSLIALILVALLSLL